MGSLLSIVTATKSYSRDGFHSSVPRPLRHGCCSSPVRQHVTTISMSNLEAAVDSGRTAHIKRALHQVGAIAVDGLSADYVRALASLRTSAPACLEGSLRVKLNDAVERFSHVQSNGEEAPKCVKADYDAIIATFAKVENEITGALANILGNSTLLVKEGSQIKELSELETKTHLHVYINNQVGDAPITNPFSLPFHQDNGLFLVPTPSNKLPVVLKDFQGRPVFTDRLGSDAVMFLVGRGLTDWLLQDAEHGMFPPPHAVPSLAGTAITDRTVMARMKIAEYNAVPAVNGGLNFMESLELHESICPLAEAGHYTPGGPLTAEE